MADQPSRESASQKEDRYRDIERIIELDFVRATEAAALYALPWLGRGEKEKADGAASDAIRGLGGEIQTQMWPRDNEEYASLVTLGEKDRLRDIYYARDLAKGQNIIFCATAISDVPGLCGVRVRRGYTETHSILLRTRTVREFRTRQNLNIKTIHLRSDNREHRL